MANNTLIIFDWDDTLFPTSWLLTNGIKLDNLLDRRKYTVYFKELDSALAKLLYKSISIGKVLIITNARTDWILLSKRILPESSKIIDTYIKIISARELYQHVYDMTEWKKRTFMHNIYNYIRWSEQIISIGDAEYEYNALISLRNYVSPTHYLKTVRFVKTPSFDTIIDQLNVITKSLPEIRGQQSHLDLKILSLN